MTDRTLDLLAEVVRLLRRFGPEEFSRLSKVLADEELVNSLRVALDTVARAVPQRPEKASQAHGEPSSAVDPNVEVLRSRLMDVSVYPHLSDIMDDVQKMGVRVPVRGFKSRKDAVSAVLRHFQREPPAALAAAIARMRSGSQKGSLEQWSEIILDRKR